LPIAFSSAGERQAGSDFPVPTFALPQNVAFSSTKVLRCHHAPWNLPGVHSVQSRKYCPPPAPHFHRFGPDFAAYARVLPDHERSVGIYHGVGTYVVTGGTGRFARATGSGVFDGTGNFNTGTIICALTGTISINHH